GSPAAPCTEPDGDCSPMPANPVPMDQTAAEAQAALLEKYLSERIFTEENVEGTEGDAIIFRLQGDDVCTTSATVPAAPECVEAVDKMELRISATDDGGDGLVLGLLIGPDRIEPLKLGLAKRTASVLVNLAAVKEAVKFLDPTAAQGLPRVMMGRVELSLIEHAAQDVALRTNIIEAIQIEMDQNGATHAFSTARASPLAELRMDGVGKAVSFELNLGPTEYRAPYGGTSALANKQVVYSLSGLSFAFNAQAGVNDSVIAHVGLGNAQSYMSVDGTKVFTADLNQFSNRHFDLNLSKGADGLPLMRVLPEFDLATKFFLAPLKADPMAEVPAFYEDQSYRVRLSGGNAPSLRPVPANTTTGFPGGLQVVSGELKLEGGSSAVTVPTGKCLVGKDVAAEGSHPLLGHFETRDCQ
ncbi:MAG TPA: hypothetical protein VK458_22485, partial [Myxococcaceae bacterium]|nr:hypothetical protein [Myxococcaceae bacterium]